MSEFIRLVARICLPLALFASLSACSWLDKTFPDKSEGYKKARPAPSLEVPPDLTTTPTTDVLVVPTASTTLSGYTSAQQSLDKSRATGGASFGVLPAQDDFKFMRDRELAWLVVKGDPNQVWNAAREFWLKNDFLIMREDPSLGVLETDWVENRAAIPQDPIRRLISRVYENAYSSRYRDRYRMRLERGEEPGTTDVFITHQGVEEIITSDVGDAPRPSGGRAPATPAWNRKCSSA